MSNSNPIYEQFIIEHQTIEETITSCWFQTVLCSIMKILTIILVASLIVLLCAFGWIELDRLNRNSQLMVPVSHKQNDLDCGVDWVAYHDEKCFKILNNIFQTFDEAVKSCANLDNASTLPIIHTKEEQDFLSNYLFKSARKLESFWIGAKYVTDKGKFYWQDNSQLTYTNWAEKAPKHRENYCVQMQADEGQVGKWIGEPCGEKNFVVCQKVQVWSIGRLQKVLISARKDLDWTHKTMENLLKTLEKGDVNKIDYSKHQFEEVMQKFTEQENQINLVNLKFDNLVKQLDLANQRMDKQGDLISESKQKIDGQNLVIDQANRKIFNQANQMSQINQKLNNLENRIDLANQKINRQTNVIDELNQRIYNNTLKLEKSNHSMPIGFIYFQLPHQPSPTSLWPSEGWSDVSTAYSGVFFRVTGGDSAPFGRIQQDNAPRLEQVLTADKTFSKDPYKFFNSNVSIPIAGWSPGILTGERDGDMTQLYLNFKYSDEEIRPLNMAIRVWKRTN